MARETTRLALRFSPMMKEDSNAATQRTAAAPVGAALGTAWQ
jgi:hypothetical protein